MRTILAATALAALTSTGVIAEEMRPVEAKSIVLGDVTGVAYYTVQPDGYEVVATLAAEAATPFRVVATLAPGQKVTLSVPGPVGSAQKEIEISRVGDRLEFGRAGQVVLAN